MKIKIHHSKTIAEIKEEFSSQYNFLKLEFFKSAHQEKEPSAKKAMITQNPQVGEISDVKKEGEVKVVPEMKVLELEAAFRDDFGLNAQVFRKSGKVWLETSATDSMTLKAQDALGKEKTKPLEEIDPNEIDYD